MTASGAVPPAADESAAAPPQAGHIVGRGMLALSVASKPLPLSVTPGVPVSVPAASVIMWTGSLVPHVVDDLDVYAVVMARSGSAGKMVRLEGTGRILVEQAAG